MTRKEIQSALKSKGILQRDLAKKAGVPESTISLFLRRKFKSARLSEIVNDALGQEAIR